MNDKIQEQSRMAGIIVRGAFKHKMDKAGKPYLHHCLRVANEACRMNSAASFRTGNSDVEVSIVGTLHDLLEDCPEWTEGALRTLFDENIVDAIVALTKNPFKDRESYEEYIDRVAENKLAVIVKLADLEDNMDITRAARFDDVNIERLAKYHAAHKKLIKYFRG